MWVIVWNLVKERQAGQLASVRAYRWRTAKFLLSNDRILCVSKASSLALFLLGSCNIESSAKIDSKYFTAYYKGFQKSKLRIQSSTTTLPFVESSGSIDNRPSIQT